MYRVLAEVATKVAIISLIQKRMCHTLSFFCSTLFCSAAVYEPERLAPERGTPEDGRIDLSGVNGLAGSGCVSFPADMVADQFDAYYEEEPDEGETDRTADMVIDHAGIPVNDFGSEDSRRFGRCEFRIVRAASAGISRRR